MDGNQVADAFREIQRYRGTRCRVCCGTNTTPYLYEGVVTVICDECSHGTRVERVRRT